MMKFIEKMLLILTFNPEASQISNILELIFQINGSLKDSGFSGEKHPLNNPNTAKLVFNFEEKTKKVVKNNVRNVGPYLAGIEKYS